MIITKTKFINYTKCPRYINKDIPTEDLSFDEYLEEEMNMNFEDMLSEMGSETLDEKHLKTMLPYYNEVEREAALESKRQFTGKFNYSRKTNKQTKFECKINNLDYLCYVDVYNESAEINIIEAKSTTINTFLKIAKEPIFKKEGNIYKLLSYEKLKEKMTEKTYDKIKSKLLDRLSKPGHYIYDLAVQRYFIEKTRQSKQINYYLAVLNPDYIFDGAYKNGMPNYTPNQTGNLINLIDITSLTEEYQPKVDEDRILLEKYLNKYLNHEVPKDVCCSNAREIKCPCLDVCFDYLPKQNSIYNYLDSSRGFKKEGINYTCEDLIKKGYYKIIDVPDEYLNREKNRIQKHSIQTNTPYINKAKIKAGLAQIKYPIYHLDFETFPCPLPRFKGEHPYTQSVFQFSLHIQKEEGKLDKQKDHYGYLAKDLNDHRLELVKTLCNLIKDDGTVLVYNDAFEKTRLKELSEIFPEYKEKLLNIRNNIFDLLDIVKSNTKLYERLGFSKEEASLPNYYNPKMNGSFSIKKVLPSLSNLTYEGMDIGNGVEALITYANFNNYSKEEYNYKYNKLIEYCSQDTYAMFEVLEGLRKYVK